MAALARKGKLGAGAATTLGFWLLVDGFVDEAGAGSELPWDYYLDL